MYLKTFNILFYLLLMKIFYAFYLGGYLFNDEIYSKYLLGIRLVKVLKVKY